MVPHHTSWQAEGGQASTVPKDKLDRAPRTASEQRAHSSDGNRAVAMLLVCVTLVFLGGALGIGLLVLYGPF